VDLTAGGNTTITSMSATGHMTLGITGSATIGSISAGTSMALDVTGAITDGHSEDAVNADGVDITAGSLSITAASLGTASDAIETNVDTLSLTVTTGAYLTESNALTLSSATVGGALNLSTGSALTVTSANTGNTTLTTGGVTSIASLTSSGSVDLTAGGNTTVTSMSATGHMTLGITGSATIGSLSAAANMGLNVAGSATLSSLSTDANLSLTVAGNTSLTSANAKGSATVTVTGAGNALSLGSLTAVNASNVGQSVTLNVAGAITDGHSEDAVNADGVDITAGSLSITAASLGTASDAIETNVDTLSLAITAGAYLTESNALTLSSATVGGALNLSTGGALTVTSANTGNATLTTGGATLITALTSSSSVDLTAGGNTTVTSMSATGHMTLGITGSATIGSLSAGTSMALDVTGAITDGHSEDAANADGVDITAGSLSITATSLGTASDAIETHVDTLSLSIGAGGAYVVERDNLTLTGDAITSNGNIDIRSLSGDLLIDTSIALTDTAKLTLQSYGGSVRQTGTESISTEMGAVDVYGLTGTSVGQVTTVSGSIDVYSPDGAFEIPASAGSVDYGSQTAKIQGSDVQIAAPISGSGKLEITVNAQGSALSTLNTGNSIAVTQLAVDETLNQAPAIYIGQSVSGALSLDTQELSLLRPGFDQIYIGSQNPTQSIVLATPTGGGTLQFYDPLVLVSSGVAYDSNQQKVSAGEVIISTGLTGKGLTILGSGSTTYLDDQVQIVQDGDVLIHDRLIVNANAQASITVTKANGVLNLQGPITVKAGATLTLSADDIRFFGFDASNPVRQDAIVLEDGATLVIGTAHLTVDSSITLDGGNSGHLVLRGQTTHGVVQDMHLSAADLAGLTARMKDNSFASLQVGQSGTQTTVLSPVLWDEGIDRIDLVGSLVTLGTASQLWNIGTDASFVATQSDLVLDADLQTLNGSAIVLRSMTGQVHMDASSSILSNGGLVTLQAATGIEVSAINANGQLVGDLSGAVALDSTAGSIVLAAVSDNHLGIRAETVSLHGYGQATSQVTVQGDRALRVESDRLQVSAPTGTVLRSANAQGESVFRALTSQGLYTQLVVVGDVPEKAVVSQADVAGQPIASAVFAALLNTRVSSGFSQTVHDWAQQGDWSRHGSAQTQAYLSAAVQAVVQPVRGSIPAFGGVVVDLNDAQDRLLLDDLAYGLGEDDTASSVLGSPGHQILSFGATAQSDPLFDYST